jgi:hypothetical protein
VYKRQYRLSAEANQLVIQTLENIRKAPCSFDMKVWATNKKAFLNPTELLDEEVGCGTSMCFAGWLVYTYGKLNEKAIALEKMKMEYPVPRGTYSYIVSALRMLNVSMQDEYDFLYISNAPKRKNSQDAALRLVSVFSDRTIKTVEELETRLLQSRLLTYETQPASKACEMASLS